MGTTNAPRVSVLMGAYNSAGTIRDAVESLKNQTFEDWELVVCDDGSSDDTLEILRELARDDERIVVLHNERNLMLPGTLNRCLAHARGEYLARADADDTSSPERLQREVDFLDAHPEYAVVGSRVRIIDDKTNSIIRGPSGPVDKDRVVFGTPHFHPTVMLRKDALVALGGYRESADVRRCEDWELWFRFYKAGYRGYNLDEELVQYHETDDDIKRRTLSDALVASRMAFRSIDGTGLKAYKKLFALMPVVSWFTPQFVKKMILGEL